MAKDMLSVLFPSREALIAQMDELIEKLPSEGAAALKQTRDELAKKFNADALVASSINATDRVNHAVLDKNKNGKVEKFEFRRFMNSYAEHMHPDLKALHVQVERLEQQNEHS